MKIFDANGDGVLQLGEYIKLVRYVVSMAALQYEDSMRDRQHAGHSGAETVQSDGAYTAISSLEDENAQLKHILDLKRQENLELKRQMEQVLRLGQANSTSNLRKPVNTYMSHSEAAEKTRRQALEKSSSALLADYRKLSRAAGSVGPGAGSGAGKQPRSKAVVNRYARLPPVTKSATCVRAGAAQRG